MMRQRIDVPDVLSIQDIEKEYGVSRVTAWRAKKRGWLYQDYHGDQSSPAVKKGITQKFIRIVQHPAINFAQLTSLSRQKIVDIIAGKSTLREADWTAFKIELTEIRNSVRRFQKSGNVKHLKEICNDARIKHHVLFDDKKMLDRLRKDMDVYDKEVHQAKEKVNRFLSEIHLT